MGQKRPNGFGLHDMHGNIYEWCEDLYDGSFYSTPEAAGLDPVCTSGSDRRVLRGGSFHFPNDDARCANRSALPFSITRYRIYGLGFRAVASPVP